MSDSAYVIERKVLDEVTKNEGQRMFEIAQNLKISWKTAKMAVDDLVDSGKLVCLDGQYFRENMWAKYLN